MPITAKIAGHAEGFVPTEAEQSGFGADEPMAVEGFFTSGVGASVGTDETHPFEIIPMSVGVEVSAEQLKAINRVQKDLWVQFEVLKQVDRGAGVGEFLSQGEYCACAVTCPQPAL